MPTNDHGNGEHQVAPDEKVLLLRMVQGEESLKSSQTALPETHCSTLTDGT